MVAIYRLKANQLSPSRIDPWHYQPMFEKQIGKIKAANGGKELNALIDPKRGIAGGATPLGADYLKNGRVRFYRTSEVDELHLDCEKAVFISDQDDEKLNRSRLDSGDVILTITGAKFGKSAVVCNKHLPGNISQHSVRFRPRRDVLDPHFLIAYLNGKTGQIAIWREAYGATRPAIDFSGIRSLIVPIIANPAQKYIGDKVRQAERLRTWAKSLETKFSNAVKIAAPEAFEDKSSGKKFSRAVAAEITYTLNPGAFDEERLRVQRYLLQLGGYRFKSLAKITGPTTNDYELTTTYIGLDAIASGNCQLSPTTVQQAGIAGTCRILAEGPVIAKLRPYLNKVAYIPKRMAGAVGSTELLCVAPKNGNSAWYLYGILKSELVLKQLRPVATGATHPRIDQHDVYDLVVPLLPNQEALGQLLERAQEAYFISKELVSAAKLLVEALIEGHLSEAELIAAQQQLDAGDTSLDRAILSRLKTDGIAGTGQPLFADLDALYALLAQAAGE